MPRNKLNSQGIAHHILLVGFMVLFAIAGVGYMVASHADPLASEAKLRTHRLKIKAVRCTIPVRLNESCSGRIVRSKANLIVVIASSQYANPCVASNRETPTKTDGGRTLIFSGRVREVKCAPGLYNLYLAGAVSIMSKNSDKPLAALNWNPDTYHGPKTQHKTLGTNQK